MKQDRSIAQYEDVTIESFDEPFACVEAAADHELESLFMDDEVTLDMSFFDLNGDLEPRNVVATIAYEDLEVAA